MILHPENPVVALCAQGLQAETERRLADARRLFEAAWHARASDRDAAIAAHFVARHQESLEQTLAWNRRALDHALAAPPDQVSTLFPSLYLNLAHSHEMLSQPAEAARFLAAGEEWLGELDDSAYAAVVRDGFARCRERLTLSTGTAP